MALSISSRDFFLFSTSSFCFTVPAQIILLDCRSTKFSTSVPSGTYDDVRLEDPFAPDHMVASIAAVLRHSWA